MATKIRLETEPESPELLEKAKVELRETPEIRQKAVVALRELLKKDGTLHYDTREDILIRYLRPTKFYEESALALMKRESEFKQKHEDVVKDLTADSIEKAINDGAPVNVFANRDQDGRRVLISYVGKAWDTGKISNQQIFQMFYIIHQAALLEPATQINGVVVILDFKDMGMKQVTNLTPRFALLLLSFIQEAMPLRLKQVHIVNEPFLFKVVWKVFSPLIKEKLNKRLWFHGSNMKSLHKYMNPDFLPEAYGGKLPLDYSALQWFPVLKSVEKNIEENNTFGLIAKK